LASDPQSGIDLHIHSTASDGTLTPSAIIQTAVRLGLKAVSITDHDTLSGSASAIESGIPPTLRFLTGIEISAAAPQPFKISGSIHILGYGIDLADPQLNALIEVLKKARQSRNPAIIAKLNALGMDLHMDDLHPIVGDGVAGRPHIAQLMIQKGLAVSIDDAFDRFLGKNRPGYVEKYRVPAKEALDAINGAGGIAVLAHPYVYGLNDPQQFETFLLTLQSMGLKGIEAIYPEHPRDVADAYCRLARKLGLLITGGTDYHGKVTPGIQMGVGDGSLHIPYSIYATLAAQLES
jgi:hypothetical protein